MKEMTQLITSQNTTDSIIGAALDNLEYYVHQIDNGIDRGSIIFIIAISKKVDPQHSKFLEKMKVVLNQIK